jgi:glutamate 5-kinase
MMTRFGMLARGAAALAPAPRRGLASAATATAQRKKMEDAKRIVIKVGTAVVAHGGTGQLAMSRLGGLVEQIRSLSVDQRRQVLLVSSGAVGLGRGQLGMTLADTTDTPSGLINRQACAATGQALLMGTYTSMMSSLGLECAQVLITQNDFVCPQRYGRLTSTLEALAMRGVIPIINENDVVTGGTELSAGEGAFSDNDMLSALVAAGVQADAVAMMTDVDAVFDKPPTEAGAKRIAVFDKQEVEIGALSAGGRGGMASKIHAAQTAAAGGVHAVVANGHDLANISRVFEGSDVGTLFVGNKKRPSKLQHWLAHAAKTTTLKGKVTVSKSAAARLSRKCEAREAPPLTMADILSTHGDFSSNAPIEIIDDEGAPIGRGLSQLASADLETRSRNLMTVDVMRPSDMIWMPAQSH